MRLAATCHKRPHPTKELAFEHMRWMVRHRGYRGNQNLNVYWCVGCGAWHVGHKAKVGR